MCHLNFTIVKDYGLLLWNKVEFLQLVEIILCLFHVFSMLSQIFREQ